MYSSRFSCAIKVAFIFNMYLKELRKKTFKKCDGTSFVASPYGWANDENKIDGVEYEKRNNNNNQNRDGSGEEPSLLYTQYDSQQGSAKTETRRPCDILRTTRIL